MMHSTTHRIRDFVCLIVLCVVLVPAQGALAERGRSLGGRRQALRVSIPGGLFSPLYGVPKGGTEIRVRRFAIDVNPVSNAEFAAFTRTEERWRKDKILRILADGGYLGHWIRDAASELWAPTISELDYPVTRVSWFAAHAYCEHKGGRLPTVNEWEFAAAASATHPNALHDPRFVEQLLAWYSRPMDHETLHDVGRGPLNYWGVRNLHGLVWEWNEDFNSVFVTGDNREDSDDLKNLFCGGSAASAADKSDYAAFMRYALRNSLRADYTLHNVGFRCAYDIP